LTGNEKILKHVLARQAIDILAEPEDLAGLALFLASDASSFCTGAVYTADGGYTI
jgi:NAD(P)-dependent dehydrogenase (short-subunit alcohol dehydrogenase family)